MTLAQDCDYIVLDEPVTYLDPDGQKEFLSMVLKLKEQGKTIVLTLHDLAQAVKISDQLAVMDHRRILMQDSPEECLKSHIIEEVFHVSFKKFTDSDGSYYFFL